MSIMVPGGVATHVKACNAPMKHSKDSLQMLLKPNDSATLANQKHRCCWTNYGSNQHIQLQSMNGTLVIVDCDTIAIVQQVTYYKGPAGNEKVCIGKLHQLIYIWAKQSLQTRRIHIERKTHQLVLKLMQLLAG